VIGLVVTLAIAAGGVIFWSRRLGALDRAAAPQDPVPSPLPRVSLIVPARNEAHNLPALLASIARLEPAPAQVVVVDDHSTDGTGDLARAAGATVVTPEELPPGWIGKPWACAAGAAAATGEYLLFTDADTTHAPDSLGRAIARMQATGADLLSVTPTHESVSLWERIQGVFQLLLLVATRAGAPTGDTRNERDFAIGQYLLFRRDAYERLGGHTFVRARVAEDLLFARGIRAAGGRYALLHAPGTMSVRMYPEGFRAFLRGWRRNFREGLKSAGAAGIVEIVFIFGWLLGLPLALVGALAAGQGTYAAIYGAATALTVVEVARRQRVVGPLPAWGALGYPFMLGAFIWCTVLGAYDRLTNQPVLWRGRRIPQPR
jgi:cellulose synthase/poly-beta-1,6-N-acetylglucosamine synthase-like glycosyltransferase